MVVMRHRVVPLLFCLATAYQKLHMVDLQQVMCPQDRGGIGYTDVNLSTADLNVDPTMYIPHVVTFLRSNFQEVTISFTLMDGNGKAWPQGTQTVTLSYLDYLTRRLFGTEDDDLDQALADGEHLFSGTESLKDGEDDDGEVGIRWRRLASRSRTSPPRRRTTPPRRRVATPRRRRTTPRRRGTTSSATGAIISAPRRRGAPVQSGPRRRTVAATPPGAPETHTRFSSPATGGTGYGYSNLNTMQSNYAGKNPTTPSYGYSEKSSYGYSGAGGKTNPVVYAGGGFAAGAGAGGTGSYYMNNRMRQSSCSGYSCCHGCSDSCYSQSRSSCNRNMNRQHYQDDIMKDGGFYPSDMMPFPITLRISQVSGIGYTVEDICPPSTCVDETSCIANKTIYEELYVTLTEMNELSDETLDASSSWRPRCLQSILALAGFGAFLHM